MKVVIINKRKYFDILNVANIEFHSGENVSMWTINHVVTLIPTLIAEIIIALILGKVLKDKPRRVKMIPFMVLSVILVVLEIFKQIIGYLTGYSLYWLPFHFCSLFLYILPIYAFSRKTDTNFYKFIESLTIVSFTLLLLFMLVYPSIVVGGGEIPQYFTRFLSFHTITFHYLSCLGFFLAVSLRVFPKSLDVKAVVLGLAGYGLLEGILANALKTNFNTMYYCGVAGIESFRQAMVNVLGWFGQCLWVLMVICGMVLLGLISDFIFKLISRILSRRKASVFE